METNTRQKNHFKQHIPNFVGGLTPIEFSFDNLGELLENDFVKGFSKSFGEFSHFGISDNHLMAFYTSGDVKFWVIGYIKNPNLIRLPTYTESDLNDYKKQFEKTKT